jgi:hypothetical protein
VSLANRLYDKLHPDQTFGALALYVSGSLPDTPPQVAYEGRLPIHNAIGACRVDLTGGTLPPGAAVTVDNDTSEVVVSWPAYAEDTITLPNGGFEDGPSGWNCGAGWAVTQSGTTYEGSWSAEYTGQGLSAITSNPYPVIPGTATSISAKLQQGRSAKYNVTLRALIMWLDADKQLAVIPGVQEPEAGVWSTGVDVVGTSGGEWKPSSWSGAVPEGAVYAVAVVSANRRRENKAAHADNIVWTFQALAVGVKLDGQYCITLRVRDSGGRIADWAGCVSVNGLGAQLSDWKYKQIAASDSTDYSAADYDDSGWSVGAAPFGSWEDGRDGGLPDAHAYDPRFALDFATPWTAFTRLWLRRTLTLAEVPAGGYTMVSYIEDNCHVYINGNLVLDSPDNPVGGSGLTTAIDASYFVIGANSIAVQCDDEPPGSGGASVVYADFLLDPVTDV